MPRTAQLLRSGGRSVSRCCLLEAGSPLKARALLSCHWAPVPVGREQDSGNGEGSTPGQALGALTEG